MKFPRYVTTITQSPVIQRGVSRAASAALLLGGLWVCLLVLAAIGSVAEGWITLPCLLLIGGLLWLIFHLHTKWERRLSDQRRQSLFISRTMQKDQRLTVLDAMDDFRREEEHRATRLAAIPRWKRLLKRFVLLLAIGCALGLVFIFFLSLTN